MPDRTPLRPLPEAERVSKLREMGLGPDLLPLNATDAERTAAMDPGLPTPAATTTEPKAGWKTSEHMALMILLGMAAYSLHMLAGLLPTIASTPGVPVWLAPLIPLAAAPILWVAHKAVAAYQEQRTALKMPPDPTEAGTEAGK